MVAINEIKSANAKELQSGLVAVFVGGTNGVGEATLKSFAKHAKDPRAYIVGRSQAAADQIIKECKSWNSGGEFTFIKSDTSLIKNVDEVCQTIKEKEQSINLLFMTTGTLNFEKETSEGLNLAAALTTYSRTRFAINFLPLIQKATGLKRIVSVLGGTKEGAVSKNNIQGKGLGMMAGRGNSSSIITLSHETLQEQYPDVSFVHAFPGIVKSGIWRDTSGVMASVLKTVTGFMAISSEEVGERHFYYATNDKFSKSGSAKGTNGKTGSGVYTVDDKSEIGNSSVEKTLAGLRSDGCKEVVWENIQEEYKRILASGRDSCH